MALPLRDFLLEHLDLIKHIAEATKNPLQIEQPASLVEHSANGTSGNVRQRKAPQMALAAAAD